MQYAIVMYLMNHILDDYAIWYGRNTALSHYILHVVNSSAYSILCCDTCYVLGTLHFLWYDKVPELHDAMRFNMILWRYSTLLYYTLPYSLLYFPIHSTLHSTLCSTFYSTHNSILYSALYSALYSTLYSVLYPTQLYSALHYPTYTTLLRHAIPCHTIFYS